MQPTMEGEWDPAPQEFGPEHPGLDLGTEGVPGQDAALRGEGTAGVVEPQHP